jgi:hypothetical protein
MTNLWPLWMPLLSPQNIRDCVDVPSVAVRAETSYLHSTTMSDLKVPEGAVYDLMAGTPHEIAGSPSGVLTINTSVVE